MTEFGPPRKSVLIVEDDPAIRDSLVELIQDDGYTVHTASNGQEALDYLNSEAELPGVILLDLMMPVMDGFQFVKAKESSPGLAAVPVALLSADAQLREKAARLGVQKWLKKPIELDAVMDVVEQYCKAA